MSSVAHGQLRALVERMPAEVKAFAEKHEPAKERWLYCLSATQHRRVRRGEIQPYFDEKGIPSCERFLGIEGAKFRLRMLRWQSFEEVNDRLVRFGGRPLDVGPIEPWQVGHVYFARVASHPHVIKIGFSRRVRDRLEDIEKQTGERLDFCTARVGIMANEAWWHRNWRSLRISGEWFYEPKSTLRALPDFLRDAAVSADHREAASA